MRLIDADALIDFFNKIQKELGAERISFKAVNRAIDAMTTIEPKRGEWEEKETFHNGDDEPIIEEWQSALCSVCHKYHTTPYMYYFNNYNFCPNCGADMREREGE